MSVCLNIKVFARPRFALLFIYFPWLIITKSFFFHIQNSQKIFLYSHSIIAIIFIHKSKLFVGMSKIVCVLSSREYFVNNSLEKWKKKEEKMLIFQAVMNATLKLQCIVMNLHIWNSNCIEFLLKFHFICKFVGENMKKIHIYINSNAFHCICLYYFAIVIKFLLAYGKHSQYNVICCIKRKIIIKRIKWLYCFTFFFPYHLSFTVCYSFQCVLHCWWKISKKDSMRNGEKKER